MDYQERMYDEHEAIKEDMARPMPEEGSISHGTMRDEDLIPTFLATLQMFDKARAEEIATEVRQLTITESSGYNTYYSDTDSVAGMSSKELAGFVLEELFEALGACAPDGCYFGAHPGDGADYGFWHTDDEE